MGWRWRTIRTSTSLPAARAWRFGVAVLRRPGLTRRVVAQAARHEGARRRCAGLLAGTLPARRVLSPFGVLRLFLGR